MSQSVLVLLIIAIALALFVTELIPLPATAMFVCVACYFTGAISAKEAFSAFGSTNVMIIAAMAIATPIAMPANAMAIEPGGYNFMDFVKPGVLLTVITTIVSIAYISIVYPPYM
ncbi:MAG: hypothetical protein HFG64_10790 [Lachnospiraceae bacterium]|nr:hypothetical protein [Lachnospiraceae bacterium]